MQWRAAPLSRGNPQLCPQILWVRLVDNRCFRWDIASKSLPESIGRYALLRELGRGSTATVFLAHDPFAGREVALKLFAHAPGDDGLTRGTHRASFLNEAALVGRLQHPHIVALLDAAVEPGYSYVVMDYVAGGTLAQHTTAGKLLPLERVVEVAFKLSRALEYAQQQGVIHRDIKPGNVLLTRPFDVKLSDFGVARIDSATHTEITGVGSPAYMSPEHLTDQPLNHQTDIYSLGAVMYQLLAGRLPFYAASAVELARQIVAQEPPRLRALRPELPEALEAIVARALQKDRRARYQSWFEFGRDLAALARDPGEPAGRRVGGAQVPRLARACVLPRLPRERDLGDAALCRLAPGAGRRGDSGGGRARRRALRAGRGPGRGDAQRRAAGHASARGRVRRDPLFRRRFGRAKLHLARGRAGRGARDQGRGPERRERRLPGAVQQGLHAAAWSSAWRRSSRATRQRPRRAPAARASPGSAGLRGLPGWMIETWQLSAASTSCA